MKAMVFTAVIAAVMVLAVVMAFATTAQAAGGCSANPQHFYSTIGARNVTITFVPGCEPVVDYSGPQDGAQLVGRFEDADLGYMWSFVWAADEPSPVWWWQGQTKGIGKGALK